MTTVYDRLADRPRTDVNVGNLPPEERRELRRIRVRGTAGLTQSTGEEFTTVYYLAGDERAAAEVFVEENRGALEAIDFANKDVVQTSVPRPVYDLILDALGERDLTTYETVVREVRPGEGRWVIERDRYESRPSRRYTTQEGVAAFVEDPLRELYDDFGREVTRSGLDAHDAVDGDPRWLLEFYRVADYACDPVTVDDELAVRKRR